MIELIFWISFFTILYTYIIYPSIIIAISKIKRKRTPEFDETFLPTVTIVIVAFNEEKHIKRKIDNCRSLDYPKDRLRICVISDGSTDSTNEILRLEEGIIFIEDNINRGKSFQLNRAISLCDSEIIVFSDARQVFKSDAVKKLVRNFKTENIGAVSGELVFLEKGGETAKSIGLYWEYEKLLRKAESELDSSIGATGAIYAVRSNLLSSIPEDIILDDVEIPMQVVKKGYRVIFESEAIAYDYPSSEIGLEFRRKVRTLAGNYQLFIKNPWFFNPFKNRLLIQTFSHKLLRLIIPEMLILLFISSRLMEGPFYNVLFYLQCIFYIAGLAGIFFRKLRNIGLINFPAVFLTLNAASIVALYKVLSGKISVRWKK